MCNCGNGNDVEAWTISGNIYATMPTWQAPLLAFIKASNRVLWCNKMLEHPSLTSLLHPLLHPFVQYRRRHLAGAYSIAISTAKSTVGAMLHNNKHFSETKTSKDFILRRSPGALQILKKLSRIGSTTPTDVDASWFGVEMVSFAPRHRRSAIHQL